MEDNTPKIFTNKAIILATFFGGPLSAGFLIGKNFKVFGNEEAARYSVLLGILATIAIFGGFLSFQDLIIDIIPGFLIPGIYTAIIAFMLHKYQGEQIKEFLANEGHEASRWIAFEYGVMGLLVILSVVFIMSFSAPIKGYEKKVTVRGNVVLLYSKEINNVKAQEIANVLKDNGFGIPRHAVDIFLNVENNEYKLKFIIADESTLLDTKLIDALNDLAFVLNDRLKQDKKIVIGFFDKKMITNFDLPPGSKTIDLQSDALSKLKKYRVNDFHTIYYNESMPVPDVQIVGESVKRLTGYFPEDQQIDIIFLNNGADYTIKFFVLKESWTNSTILDELKGSVTYFNDGGIRKFIHLVLVDNQTREEKQL